MKQERRSRVREISADEARAHGLPMTVQMATTRYETWGVRERLDHCHSWVVYPQEVPPLRPGERYAVLRTKDERLQAKWDAEKAANDAKGYYVASCLDCGVIRIRVNDEPK